MIKRFFMTLLCPAILVCAEQEAAFKSNKCKTFRNLNVCYNLNVGNSLTVAGNEVVGGTVTAANFATPAGILPVGGDLAYAYSLIQNAAGATTIDNGAAVPFDAVATGGGISLDTATGVFTVDNAGIYKVQFQVRGQNASANADPIMFNLESGATTLGIFSSDDVSADGGAVFTALNGTLVVSLDPAATLSLVNVTPATVNVTLGEDGEPTGTVDAFILIERIA